MLSNVKRTGIDVLVVLCTVITVGLQAIVPEEFALYFIGACLLLGVALLSFFKPCLHASLHYTDLSYVWFNP